MHTDKPGEPVTVLIPCFNSEKVIRDCLESVGWADEIFVVDSFSTDSTLDICREYTDRIIQHEYINSATQKNWAIPQATHDWVLIVDTDERVTPALRDEVRAVLADLNRCDGYRIPRRNHCFERPMYYGGSYPDYQLRLFRKDRGRYQDREVHAHVLLDGRIGTLQNPFMHYGQRDVDQIVRVLLLRYTTWEAQQKNKEGVRFRPSYLFTKPLLTFGYRYFYRRGFRDGAHGLFMALVWVCYAIITYAKLWRIQADEKADR
ncbi:MAG: glycosyltransferase family 2 protein [Armatimonadetes bacterium]|nr:glycosyltransferase family 2 protein [Armatimonadota bacterium]